jgi:hypothetical protein
MYVCWGYRCCLCFFDFSIGCWNCSDSVVFFVFRFIQQLDNITTTQSNCLFVCLMVFNLTFNNISVISLRSVLLVEETAGPGENHRHVASHRQTLSHNVVYVALIEIRTHNISDDRHWLHTITATMACPPSWIFYDQLIIYLCLVLFCGFYRLIAVMFITHRLASARKW